MASFVPSMNVRNEHTISQSDSNLAMARPGWIGRARTLGWAMSLALSFGNLAWDELRTSTKTLRDLDDRFISVTLPYSLAIKVKVQKKSVYKSVQLHALTRLGCWWMQVDESGWTWMDMDTLANARLGRCLAALFLFGFAGFLRVHLGEERALQGVLTRSADLAVANVAERGCGLIWLHI